MKEYVIVTRVTARDDEQAEKVRSEIAQSLEDARDSGVLGEGVQCSVDDASPVSGDRQAKLVELARGRYAIGSDDDIEVYDDARTSTAGSDGEWVEAWVYIPPSALNEAGLLPSAEQGTPEEAVESEGGHCD